MATEADAQAQAKPGRSLSIGRVLTSQHSDPGVVPTIFALAALSGLGAAMAGTHPTGLPLADPVIAAVGGVVIVLAASRAQRTAWIVSAAIAGVCATGTSQLIATIALVVACIGALLEARSRVLGALVGALVVQSIYRLPSDGLLRVLDAHGASALAGIVAGGVLVWSGYQRARPNEKRAARKAATIAGGLALLGAGLLAICVAATLRDLNAGLSSARTGLDQARSADTEAAAEEFEVAAKRLDHAHAILGGWWLLPVRAVPLVGQHAKTLDVVSGDAARLAAAAQLAAETGDYQDLRYESGRFDLRLMRRLQKPLLEASDALETSQSHLHSLPVEWLLSPLQSRLHDFDKAVKEAQPDARLASDAVEIGPTLLGGDGDQRYLILFTTPAEQRGLGGFVGAYGELTASDGGLELSHSGPIDELIKAVPRGQRILHASEDYTRRYGPLQPQDYLQDLTLSPDFPSVAAVAADLYQQSVDRDVNGVLMLDPYGLAALLKITGAVKVEGLGTLDAKNAPRILMRDQYLDNEADSARQELLQAALRATFRKLTDSSLPGPKAIAKALGPATDEGRMMVWSLQPKAQSVFEAIGADGSMALPDGDDFISVRGQNSAHNKIDSYLQRSYRAEVTLDPGIDLVRTKLTVNLRNTAPESGLTDYVIGNTVDLPRGTNRMTLTVYSAMPSVHAYIDGKEVGIGADREFGWYVSTVSVTIPAGATRSVELDLQAQRDLSEGYSLRLDPHPAANVTKASVRIEAVPGFTLTPKGALESDDGVVSGSTTLTTAKTFRTAIDD